MRLGPLRPTPPWVAAPRDDFRLSQRQSAPRVPSQLWAPVLSGLNLPSHSSCHHSSLPILPVLPLPLLRPQFLPHRSPEADSPSS